MIDHENLPSWVRREIVDYLQYIHSRHNPPSQLPVQYQVGKVLSQFEGDVNDSRQHFEAQVTLEARLASDDGYWKAAQDLFEFKLTRAINKIIVE